MIIFSPLHKNLEEKKLSPLSIPKLATDWNSSEIDPEKNSPLRDLINNANNLELLEKNVTPEGIRYTFRESRRISHGTFPLRITIDRFKNDLLQIMILEVLKELLSTTRMELKTEAENDVVIIDQKTRAHLLERWWTPNNGVKLYVVESLDWWCRKMFYPIVRDVNTDNLEWDMTIAQNTKAPFYTKDSLVIPNITVCPLEEMFKLADSLDSIKTYA